jgi:tellurite methyltransferase
MQRIAPWDIGYARESVESFWGPPCCLYSEIVAGLRMGADVLDAGCGDGRHSLMFARLGFSVTAVDISPRAVNKLNRVASEEGLKLTTILKDITSFRHDHKFDLILAHGLLHLLPLAVRPHLIDQFRQNTRNGGYNVAVVITSKIPLPRIACSYMNKPFNDGELRRQYDDWEILVDEAYSQPATPRIPYRRHFNRLVARCAT